MRLILLFFSLVLLSGCANSWYLGEWKVTDVEFPAVSALGAEEAQEWFGEEAIYAESLFSFRENTCEAPQYAPQELSEADFRIAYRAPFSQLNIDGEATEILRVSCAETSSFPGMTLIKGKEDIVYLPWDGAFFKLERSVR